MKHLATAALLLTLVASAPAGAAAPSGAPPPAPQTAGDTRARVEVNRASLAELIGVPGIGERLAQAIIDLREKKGPFTKLDDLLEVRGIGEKNLALFAEHLVVAPPPAGAVPAKVSAAK